MNNIIIRDTIFAQATARGKAGVAIMRISGSKSLEIAKKLTKQTNFEPNKFYLCDLWDKGLPLNVIPPINVNPTLNVTPPLNVIPTDVIPALNVIPAQAGIQEYNTGSRIKSGMTSVSGVTSVDGITQSRNEDVFRIDRAMLVYFKSPNSFTGEDVVELHTHGSIAVIKLLTQVLLSYEIRLAEAGEFSKRAFLNGKMDLTAAEGLSDLIDAETITQHRHAMLHMSGEFEKICSDWRAQLLKILSLIEVYLDFPDENIPVEVLENSEIIIGNLKNSLNHMLDDNRRGERLRNGIIMAIIGPTNAGKSSLINYLAKRDIAIISDIAGTTRDVIETHLDIGGYPIILADTAGLRNTSDDIEKQGIEKAIGLAKNADIKLIMLDVTIIDKISETLLEMLDENSIIVVNKIDLAEITIAEILGRKIVPISLKTGAGLDVLLNAIIDKAENLADIGNHTMITRERHRYQISQASFALDSCDLRGDLVLAAEDIRIAARHLSLLTGKIEIEEILGEIFQNFCIGK